MQSIREIITEAFEAELKPRFSTGNVEFKIRRRIAKALAGRFESDAWHGEPSVRFKMLERGKFEVYINETRYKINI